MAKEFETKLANLVTSETKSDPSSDLSQLDIETEYTDIPADEWGNYLPQIGLPAEIVGKKIRVGTGRSLEDEVWRKKRKPQKFETTVIKCRINRKYGFELVIEPRAIEGNRKPVDVNLLSRSWNKGKRQAKWMAYCDHENESSSEEESWRVLSIEVL